MPCEKMERVTYPSAAVTNVLAEGFIRVVLDVNDDKDALAPLEPRALPEAIVLTAEGKQLGRVAGFVGPEEHAAWLTSFRN